jgi:hypothetical protein
VVKAPTLGNSRINFDPNDMSQGLESMLVTIEWHLIELHVPTYFHYISVNINHVSTPTQAKYSTNQDGAPCFSYGKYCFVFPPCCACAKQGGGSFA